MKEAYRLYISMWNDVFKKYNSIEFLLIPDEFNNLEDKTDSMIRVWIL